MPHPRFTRARTAARRRVVTAVEEGVRNSVEDRVAALERKVDELLALSASHHQHVLDEMRRWERRQRRDLMTAVEQQAAIDAAAFMIAEMPHVERFTHPHDTLRHAVASAAGVSGMALEFGVASGRTLRVIAEHHTGGPVVGFDSFEGLPEHWRLGFDVGKFAGEPPEVPGAQIVVGWFDQTLPGFLAEHEGPVAFLHLDADLYSSTATVLEQVGPRLVPGSVVLFDEYFNYPGWREHEHKAWMEHVERTGLTWRYLAVTLDDEQVSVVVTGLG